MDSKRIIEKIYKAFDGVVLDDGVGLWEGQGIDDYLSESECSKLRAKDETKDWRKISVLDLFRCNSSLSFFDAKGMRFHIPQFLLYALDSFIKEENKMDEEGKLKSFFAPDVEFHLTSMVSDLNKTDKHSKGMLEYHRKRFSLLNIDQLRCIVSFLEYKIYEMTPPKTDLYKYNNREKDIEIIQKAIKDWQQQIRIRLLNKEKLWDSVSRVMNWKEIAFYEYDSKDELWDRLVLVVLPKNKKLTNDIEVIHLAMILLSETYQEGVETRWTGKKSQKFFEGFIKPYFGNYQFQDVELEEFKNNYDEIMDGINSSECVNYFKNKSVIKQPINIDFENILLTLRDLNQWNQRLYFLETANEYILFDWGTGV